MKNYGRAFLAADKSLKADRGFVLEAMKQNGEMDYTAPAGVLEYADETLKADRDFVLEAVKINDSLRSVDWISSLVISGAELVRLNIWAYGVELVAGEIDKESAEQIDGGMGWDEVKEIVGDWYDNDGILHEHCPEAPLEIDVPNLKLVNAGTEKIPMRGHGYTMVAVAREKGTLGNIAVDSDFEELKYYRTTFKVGGHELELVTGFNYKGEDLELNTDNLDSRGTSVEIAIYKPNGALLWSG